jgi:hypothetical protein
VRKARLWRRLFGLGSDTVIEAVDWDVDPDALVVSVRLRKNAKLVCGRCGAAAPRYDQGEGRREWRAMDVAFEQSIYALAENPEPPKRLWYWGDLDPDGIAIPTQAAKVAATLGLPELQPARALWAAMAELPGTAVGKVTWTATTGAWLGDDLWAAAARVRAAGARVAQERVAPPVVAGALGDLQA